MTTENTGPLDRIYQLGYESALRDIELVKAGELEYDALLTMQDALKRSLERGPYYPGGPSPKDIAMLHGRHDAYWEYVEQHHNDYYPEPNWDAIDDYVNGNGTLFIYGGG
jgi:hypothetical protein